MRAVRPTAYSLVQALLRRQRRATPLGGCPRCLSLTTHPCGRTGAQTHSCLSASLADHTPMVRSKLLRLHAEILVTHGSGRAEAITSRRHIGPVPPPVFLRPAASDHCISAAAGPQVLRHAPLLCTKTVVRPSRAIMTERQDLLLSSSGYLVTPPAFAVSARANQLTCPRAS